MTLHRTLACVLFLAIPAACSPAPDAVPEATPDTLQTAVQEPQGPPPELMVHLDSGSAAFRANDFQGALNHYTRAAEVAPDYAAAWFGVYMAHQALGNEAGAREALERAQALDPDAVGAHPELSKTPR